MLNTTDSVLNMINSPSRQVGARVIITGSSSPIRLTHRDKLKKFVVDRVGENGKFFGYGVSHKATVEILDPDREYDIAEGNVVGIAYNFSENYIAPYPSLYVEPKDTKRDEKTNTITVVAYDALYKATAITYSEIAPNPPYTIEDVANACASALGLEDVIYNGYSQDYNGAVYDDGANLDGAETLREILDDIAEITHTIYYIDTEDNLVFIDYSTSPVATIDKSQYFELSSGKEYTLTKLTHATELGDNITEGAGGDAEQVIKDNAFMSLREDLPRLLGDIYDAVDGMCLTQFSCSWRGNPLIEVGDCLEFENKDGTKLSSIFVNDTHTYNGGLSATTSWEYTQATADSSNPTTLGQALKETYAKVDKANKQIEMVVSEVSGFNEAISSFNQTTNEIAARVSAVESQNTANDEEIATLKSQVEMAITKDALTIEIQKELNNGVNKVATNTGYTFDDTGLTIEKDSSEIKTQITEDGMTVYKNDEAVLTANNQGVKAKDLHAVTFLIIGNNSRFEDYGSRTGCFWIGGNS